MNAKKAREMFANGELTTGDAVEDALGMIADLQDQITALETRAIRRLEIVEEAVWTIDVGSKPAPEPETVTISKADWDTTQERVGNAINALYDVLKLLSRGAETVEIEAVCNVALEADGDYEVKLGM
jgi:hypothetical protein